ncbi:MAG: aconitase X [Candidatus Aenigmatarchaeota archaeon]
MHLTEEEEKMLESDNPAVRKAMKLLVKLGDIYGAEEMVEVSSAQASGVSYKSIGDPGMKFLEEFADEGAEVSVPTFANPAGMDLDNWSNMNISEKFAEKQKRIIDAMKQMGINITTSCTPYLWSNLPRRNEHIAWAESSAVSFANSVIGARTNREGGPSALAAAITGRTPKHGLHLEENREPTHVVEVDADMEEISDFGALGSWVGERVEDGKPYFFGIGSAGTDQLKSLGAAMAASGAVALYFVEDITVDPMDVSGLERLEFTGNEMEKEYESLSKSREPELVVFGCPHCSISEIEEIAKGLEGEELKKDLWVLTSKAVKAWADRMGYTQTIEEAGGQVLSDTCNVVCPIEDMKYERTGTNSGKAANYLPGFCEQDVTFASKDELLDMVI